MVRTPVSRLKIIFKNMGTLIVGLISLALLVYLIVAMIWPEKF
jgi:K+-transporting ATPase KdpF subunit